MNTTVESRVNAIMGWGWVMGRKKRSKKEGDEGWQREKLATSHSVPEISHIHTFKIMPLKAHDIAGR
jgi:hypothetical protein